MEFTRQDHESAPFADAIHELTAMGWQQLEVPGHQGSAEGAPGVAKLVGADTLRRDIPMMFSQIDQETWRMVNPHKPNATELAQRLAADAWGARRMWFLTNGASMGNHVATAVARMLGTKVIVQRSVHSSVIDGIAHTGLDAQFVYPTVDLDLGSAHGVTADQISEALRDHPDAGAVYVVSPSYFGAVADVAAIAEVAHAAGKPLIVDEAWGSHFGFHPDLPRNAVRDGADLVISSTHKAAGSLTQSALLMLGHSKFAVDMEDLVHRAYRSFQSTSSSALLMASLDEARRNLVLRGYETIQANLDAVERIRAAVRASETFRDVTDSIRNSLGSVAHDPFKVVIDVRGAGMSGGEAAFQLIRDHRIVVELSTPAVIVLLVGATSVVDDERFLKALFALKPVEDDVKPEVNLPGTPERAMGIHDAFYSSTDVVPAAEAVGRISADSLAAYPPGIPNLLPGEIIRADTVQFLQATAASPSGYVRGAADPLLQTLRVVRV